MLRSITRIYQSVSNITIHPIPTKLENEVFDTPYGLVKMVRNPFWNVSKLKKINKLYYLVNGTSSNFIKSVLKKENDSLILFDCEKMHYQNAFELFQATKGILDEQYFGNSKKPKNPFEKCKNGKEVFHLHRNILIAQKTQLGRLCLHVAYNGELRIQGFSQDKYQLKSYLDDNYNVSDSRYRKHDYLLPFNSLLGIGSAHGYEQEGLVIEQLKNQKIYALFGVWPPTQKQYLNLFDEYMHKFSKYHKLNQGKLNIIDLGCGTGVLGMIANKNLEGKDCQIYGVDNVKNAVKSSKINAQCLEMQNYRAEEADILDDEKLEYELKELKFPTKYELIVANPPWIQASKLNEQDALENTTTDPNGQMVKAVFRFANKYLQINSHESQKGRLVIIYSDLSQNLALQEGNIIEQLCKQYNMVITYRNEQSFLNNVNDNIDPLIQYKEQSKVILYEIQKS